jgi:hypothetical protein
VRERRPRDASERVRDVDHDRDRDGVVGFGADVPAFLLRAAPRPTSKD